MKTAMNFREATIARRAKNVGLHLEKGFQKYLHHGWGYVTDEQGNRIKGYQLFDCAMGLYHPASHNDIYTHCSVLDRRAALELLDWGQSGNRVPAIPIYKQQQLLQSVERILHISDICIDVANQPIL